MSGTTPHDHLQIISTTAEPKKRATGLTMTLVLKKEYLKKLGLLEFDFANIVNLLQLLRALQPLETLNDNLTVNSAQLTRKNR